MKKKYILVALLLSSIACFSQFSENFESGVPGNFIETQDAEAISWGDCGGSLGVQTCPISGATSASFYRASYTTSSTSLETPVMDLSSGNYQLSFDHSQEAWGADQNTLLVEISVDNGGSFVTIIDFTGSIQNVTSEVYLLDTYATLSATTIVRFTGTSNYGRSVILDNVVIAPPPSCLEPNTLTATGLTPTSADLGWSTGGSGEADWQVVVQAPGAGMPGGAGTSTSGANPYTDNTLSAATDYEFYVRADCGGGDYSEWVGPFLFSTPCGTITPDYLQDFSTFLPNCWEEGDDTDIATGPNGTNGAWATDDYLNNVANGESAKVNLYGNAINDWLVSPVFNLSAGGYELKFDVGAVAWNGTVAETPNPMGSDDEVHVLISDDDGATWSALEVFNVANAPSAVGDAKTYDLTGYTSTTTKFAFWATEGTTDDSEDYDFFIDNFTVRTIPSCVEPNTLTASGIASTSANLGWTTGGSGEGDWEVVIQAPGTGVPTGTGTSTSGANPYAASGLSPATDYEFYVRANCGGSGYSTWVGPYAFTTLCGTLTPAYTNDFSTFPGNCWEEGNDTDVATGPNNTDGAWQIDDFLNNPANGMSAKMNFWDASDQDWIVSPTFDLSAGSYGLAFDVGAVAWNGTVAETPNPMGSDDEVHVLISNDDGATWSALDVFNVANAPSETGDAKLYDLAAYTSATTKFAFWGTEGTTDDGEDYDFFINNFMVDAYVVLGVEELQTLEGFKYFPNPVNNRLTVQAQNNIESLQIVSMLGQVVKTAQPNLQSYSLDISDLSAGVYFIKAKVNQVEGTFRIVKQ
jgi:hypothetical protein